MAKLRFGISKTPHEWELLENVVRLRNVGKPEPTKGTGISKFIHGEINKSFKGLPVEECSGERATRTRRDFDINVRDEVADHIICEAKRTGIPVGELIAKKIIDPHITS